MLDKLSHILLAIGLAIGIMGGVVYVAAKPTHRAVVVQCETVVCKQELIASAFR